MRLSFFNQEIVKIPTVTASFFAAVHNFKFTKRVGFPASLE